ncbi:MAG: DegV family protein [Eubacteriales bacterium]|nr:DegV family protein [Eubacteriales bacterium]
MANDYVLSCCTTADLTEEQYQKLGIRYICAHYELDGKPYVDDIGKTMSAKEFYAAMANGADTKTYQINPQEFREYFEEILKEGKDLLHLSLSSGISGTFASASAAAEELREEYPDRKIYVVDSLAASSGFGFLMDKLSELKAEGMGIDELKDWAEANRLHTRHWFFSTDLTFFIKGGRISKTSGFVGNLLNICPLMDVSVDGKLIPRHKIRTKKKVIQEAFKKMQEQAEGREDYSGKVFISNSACYEDARKLADLIEGYFPKMNGKVVINDIGTGIGAHTGPGTVALFFWGDERVD